MWLPSSFKAKLKRASPSNVTQSNTVHERIAEKSSSTILFNFVLKVYSFSLNWEQKWTSLLISLIASMQINHQLSTWLQLFEHCHTSPQFFVKPRLTNARLTLNISTLCRPRFPLLPSAVLVKDWMFFGKGFYLPSTVAWFLSPWLTTNWQITLSLFLSSKD